MRISDWSSDVCSSDLDQLRAYSGGGSDRNGSGNFQGGGKGGASRRGSKRDNSGLGASRSWLSAFASRSGEQTCRFGGAGGRYFGRRYQNDAERLLAASRNERSGRERRGNLGQGRKSTRLKPSNKCATRLPSSA